MKLYPFSVQKHAHDIEFRRNRVKNIIYDILSGEIKATNAELERLEKLLDDLNDLLLAVMNSRDGRIAYLTGKQIGLAKETVLWAGTQRAEIMARRKASTFA